MPLDLSIVVPAYREAESLPLLVEELQRELTAAGVVWEAIVVDDDSRDGTEAVCARLRKNGVPLRLRVRRNVRRDLSAAVLAGFRMAEAPIWAVMDADRSHRGSDLARLYRAVRAGAAFAAGSRYVPGGSTDDRWTLYRYLNSHAASLLARPLARISDPMSGFFAFPRELVEKGPPLSPVGYKIGLEILVKCRPDPVREVPIHFRTRVLGESKLTVQQQLLYLVHLGRLYRFRFRGC